MAKRILRPLGVGELLDEVFDLYKKNFLLLLPLMIIVEVFTHLAQFNLMGQSRHSLCYFLAYPVTSIANGAFIYAISACYFGGRPDVTSSYRAVAPLYLPLLITGLMAAAVSLACLMLLLIPGIIIYVYLAFTYQVVVFEKLAYMAALRRSWRLVRGQWFRVAAILLVAALMMLFVYWGVTGLAVYLLKGKWAFSAANQGPYPALAGFFTSVLISPIYAITSVILYYDLRVRKEGFDIEQLATEVQPAVPG